jgi:hypothetical protein
MITSPLAAMRSRTRAPKPMATAKRVTLAAVGTLGVAAALGLGGTAQAVAAPSSGPGSTGIALGTCFDWQGRQIACPPPGGSFFPGGGGAGSYDGGASPSDPVPDTPPDSWPAEGGGGNCVGDEIVCHDPF